MLRVGGLGGTLREERREIFFTGDIGNDGILAKKGEEAISLEVQKIGLDPLLAVQ